MFEDFVLRQCNFLHRCSAENHVCFTPSGAHPRHASEDFVSRVGVSWRVHTRLACAVASGDAAWGRALATSKLAHVDGDILLDARSVVQLPRPERVTARGRTRS